MGHDDQPAAYVSNAVHLLRIENGASADKDVAGHALRKTLDASEGLR
jgi:hypothetical protein